MEGQLAVPFHFAVEFLVLVVVMGAAINSLRARRHGAGPWALGQAAGFFLLAVAQAAHGALVVQADGATVTLALRAAGFLVLVVAARPGTAAVPIGGAAVAGLFFPGVDATWAMVPALAAIGVAVRGAGAHRTDQDPTTFAFSGAFVAFAAAEITTIMSPESGGTMLGISHALRAIAALFLARWLWSSIVRSVRMRFVAAFVIVLSVLVLVISGALNLVIGNTLRNEEFKRLAGATSARVDALQELSRSALGAARQFARNERVVGYFDLNAEDFMQLLAVQSFQLLENADFIVFVDRVGGGGRVLASAESIRAAGQETQVRPLSKSQALVIAGSEVVAAEALARGNDSSSPTPISFSTRDAGVQSQIVVLGAAVSSPVVGGRVAGVVVVGYRVDQGFLAEVREDTRAEATLVVGNDRVVSTTFPPSIDIAGAVGPLVPRLRLAAADRCAVEEVLRLAREERCAVRSALRLAGEEYVTTFVPIETEDGQAIGLLGLSAGSEPLAAAQRDITRTLFLITLAAVAIAAALAWLSGGRVTRPIRSLTAAARALREGNLEARTKVVTTDEVGSLGTAFNEMADELQRKTGDLRRAALQEATLRGRMEAILQSMGDGLVATDAAGVVVIANHAAAEMIGRKEEWPVGRRIDEVVNGVAANGRPLAAVAMAGRSTEGTLRSGGGTIPVAITSAPLRDEVGEPNGRVVVMRDISREHEAERMKSEFLSNVSHELRTPITPIKGYAEIMRRKKFPREKAEQFLEGILESTERLERIVEILVDFAAIEAGRLKPQSVPVPVKDLLDGVAARWRDKTRAHQFVRKRDIAVHAVRGDPKLLQRSLDELMDNAVKFSPSGGRIEINAEAFANGSRARKPSKVRITIRDHGIGIEPDRMPDLFQDFRQLDGSETRSYGGLGLGLAYVKRIAAVHGGDVQVESAPGRGSAFSLVLPIADEMFEERKEARPAVRKPKAVVHARGRAKGRPTRRSTTGVKAAPRKATATPRKPARAKGKRTR